MMPTLMIFTTIVTVLAGRHALAQVTVAPDQMLGASDPQPYDALGYGIAVDGASMLVGARGSDSIALNGGAVYAFTRGSSGWVQSQKLVFTMAALGDEIGAAIAVRGTVGVAGAPLRGNGGAAFAMRFDGGAWFPVAELSDAAAGANAEFGASVACTSEVIAVGAPASTEGVGLNAGRVRLFTRSGTQWLIGDTLRATYPDPGDRFGFCVAMDGDWLAVTAPGDDDAAVNAGAVWLYRRSAGQFHLVHKLLPPDIGVSIAGASFGQSVDLKGNLLVVGATLVDASAADSGAAFRYELSAKGVSLAGVLVPPSDAVGAQFGFSVATDGTSVVIGAPGLRVDGQLRGGAFVYLGGSDSSGVLAPTNGSSLLLTGTRVVMSDSSVIATSPTASAGVVASCGQLYVLDRLRDCDANGVPDAIDVADGSLRDDNGDGVPDACQCVADVTGDGFVNGADLSVLLAFWGSTSPALPSVDIDRDGAVGGPDLALLLSGWGVCN